MLRALVFLLLITNLLHPGNSGAQQIVQCHSGGTGTIPECQRRDALAQQQAQQQQIVQCHSGGAGTIPECQRRDALAQQQVLQQQSPMILRNGQWVPQGTWNPNPIPANPPQGYSGNPQGLPVFVPPIITDRVRGPNYTWLYQRRYQYTCPQGYYCPPVDEAAGAPPVMFNNQGGGLGGEIQKACWEIDCGKEIAESLLKRGIRGALTK